MKVTFFGLTITSSWGNGHATPYRAILRALHRRGLRLAFYEKDVPYYAEHRDLRSCDYCDLHLYSAWDDIRGRALAEAGESDIVVTASYCPDGARINDDILNLSGPLRVFYDLDTPITLGRLAAGPLDYLRRPQIPEFDLYLSFTGGRILRRIEQEYGAPAARPLYGCVDPDQYRRVASKPQYDCALSFLGTYAADRQQKIESLFLQPAYRSENLRFVLAGSLYPRDWPWPANVRRYEHLGPGQHPGLYSSSRATLNVTRREMAESGYCPSGRFFEAAACATPILTDAWDGLENFFQLDREIFVVRGPEDVLACLQMPESALREAGERARERTLDEHTGECRAQQFLAYCEEAQQRQYAPVEATA